MRFILVMLAVSLLSEPVRDSVVTEFLCTIDQKFQDKESFICTGIEQPYFERIEFLNIDTCLPLTVPRTSGGVQIRIAIDKDANVYQLRGFDKNEYNLLIALEPLALKAEDVYPYGEFFLGVTELEDSFDYMFIVNTEAFVAENRRRMKDAESDWFYYGTKNRVTWEEMEGQIRAMCDGFQWRTACWKDADSVYESQYLAWMQDTGALRYFKLQIYSDGRADKVADSVWSESIGYYNMYQM